MKIKKLEKRLLKEYGKGDGRYVRIDRIVNDYDADGSLISLIGAYGYKDADGKYHQADFELVYDGADGNNLEYIAGKFAQYIEDIEVR